MEARNFRGEVQDEYRDTVSIDDIGSYERMEGSIPSGKMTLFFTGRTLSGRWKLEKLSSDPRRRSWSFGPVR